MTAEKVITSAIKKIEQAKVHVELASNFYNTAIAELRAAVSTADTRITGKKKGGLTAAQIAKIEAGMHKRLNKVTN